MSRKSVVQRNLKRVAISAVLSEKRRALVAIIKDESLSMS
ncbi:MAG: 30S ribosomal protein S14, partial [Anaplasma sp.]|nr:30S ribosomal protein S14 [Anaplasma sp.]